MKPDPDRADVALGVDMLAPEGYGEIIGGGERLADLDLLLQRIKEHHLPQETFEQGRSVALRHGAPRRLWHGNRARRRLDLRPRARPRNDPVPAYAVQAVSVGCRGARPVTMKIGLGPLGCPKNLVDSEVMLGLAREAGHELTEDPDDADILDVNTCAFIDKAKVSRSTPSSRWPSARRAATAGA